MISPDQMPKNFNLERYSQITPNANAWASNLNDRWEIIDYLNKRKITDVIYGLNNFYEQSADEEPPITDEEQACYDKYDFPDWSRAASPLTVGDAEYFSNAISTIKHDCLRIEPISNLMHDLPYLHNYMNIDLTAPDDIIIKAVMANVDKARQELGIKKLVKRYTGKEFFSWQTHKLLPYLDLLIWSKAVGIRLTKDDAIEVLFDGEDNRKLDKTMDLVKLFFGKDINERTDALEALTAQGIQELSESNWVNELNADGMVEKSIAKKAKLSLSTVRMHGIYPYNSKD